MARQNPYLAQLKNGYLFPEINKRKIAFLNNNPQARLINLGIGDTTLPLPSSISSHLANASLALGYKEKYTGYGPDQGEVKLREKIVERFYQNQLSPEEVFISDGAKCDLGRLQLLFAEGTRVAVQDPVYPVYVDTSLISGKEQEIIKMLCLPENDFFPETFPEADIVYICSPNNPTGSAASRSKLEYLVSEAKKKKFLVIYDAAYGCYIKDPNFPKSIYEIEGAKEVAIEVNSFSKLAGFTGVRLGWSVVPKELLFEDGASIHKAWHRIQTTFFNGASNIAQKGGIAVLENEGWNQIQKSIAYYLENARVIKETFLSLGYEVFGGVHAPFVWVNFSPLDSWSAFEEFLKNGHLVTTPGSGFGPCGEGYLRFSALGQREEVVEAMGRVVQVCG